MCLRLKHCSKFLPKIIISKHKKQVFCAMNSARKRMLSWRSYSLYRKLYNGSYISNQCVCMYNQGTPLFPKNNSLPAISCVCLFLGLRKVQIRTSFIRQSGGKQIQFPLFGKETASFIEKELRPNAYFINYNTIKYVFRRRAVQ